MDEHPLEQGFRSTKKDKKNHGKGHRILEKTVTRMDGEIFYEDKGERFLVRVLVKIS